MHIIAYFITSANVTMVFKKHIKHKMYITILEMELLHLEDVLTYT